MPQQSVRQAKKAARYARAAWIEVGTPNARLIYESAIQAVKVPISTGCK